MLHLLFKYYLYVMIPIVFFIDFWMGPFWLLLPLMFYIYDPDYKSLQD